ncbi:hypothetical protein M9Y10_038179 [Tritrichomonas musculus]|uniref:RRM domain-containing protein n=1 Tax=Tritrichomonas musculus TaxID=1915356 RepID=A0ABR2K7P3_9EUKA
MAEKASSYKMNNHAGKKKEVKPCETLYISNIPSKSCSIPKIFQHFRNYGHIQSIYAYGTNASITFSSKEEAMIAIKSPEAFENNRFVRYHFHLHPDKADDRLSLLVDKDFVQTVTKEVNQKIAQEQRRTIELQSQLKNSTQKSEESNLSNQDQSNNIEYLASKRPEIQQTLKKLQKEKQTAPPEKESEIQSQIDQNLELLNEIDKILKRT